MPNEKYIFVSYAKGISIDQMTDVFNFDKNIAFFYAEVQAPNDLPFGLLPFRDIENKNIIYPLGKFHGTWTSPELQLAYDNGYNIKVYYGYIFDKVDTYFDEYIDFLYKAKERSTRSHRSLYKSLLNNFLGRFGMRHDKGTTFIIDREVYDKLNTGYNLSAVQEINDNTFIINTDLIPTIKKTVNLPEFDSTAYYMNANAIINNRGIKNRNTNYSETSVMITSLVNAYARVYFN
uniref:DNA-directed DNA polymerase n=1 Tax=Candida corydali TaxID=391826 RepID=S5TGI2_9ASCO|nr:hypothetical protein [Candida corydali]AGS44542.1 hypothetical protein [Candida corydali]